MQTFSSRHLWKNGLLTGFCIVCSFLLQTSFGLQISSGIKKFLKWAFMTEQLHPQWSPSIAKDGCSGVNQPKLALQLAVWWKLLSIRKATVSVNVWTLCCLQWHRKRKRRSCGECKACLCRKDCGTCDFCIDKPKFGGSNKKRQKCRLRQCQRQAMVRVHPSGFTDHPCWSCCLKMCCPYAWQRHLLPYQMGIGEYGSDGPLLAGRSRPHYTYSRKSNFNSYKGSQSGFDLSDNEDEDNNLQPVSVHQLSLLMLRTWTSWHDRIQ